MESIPKSGLGTWKIPNDMVEEIVYQAIKELGVRHIDCACDYGNEIEVGRGIKKIIDEGILKRGNDVYCIIIHCTINSSKIFHSFNATTVIHNFMYLLAT